MAQSLNILVGKSRSVNFEMSFWCDHFNQKTNEIILRISALASKKSSNQKPKYKYVK